MADTPVGHLLLGILVALRFKTIKDITLPTEDTK